MSITYSCFDFSGCFILVPSDLDHKETLGWWQSFQQCPSWTSLIAPCLWRSWPSLFQSRYNAGEVSGSEVPAHTLKCILPEVLQHQALLCATPALADIIGQVLLSLFPPLSSARISNVLLAKVCCLHTLHIYKDHLYMYVYICNGHICEYFSCFPSWNQIKMHSYYLLSEKKKKKCLILMAERKMSKSESVTIL